MKKISIAFLVFTIVFLTISSVFSDTIVRAVGTADSWETLTPMITARSGLCLAVVDGKIFAISGSYGATLSVNEMYDPATDSWTTKQSIPGGDSFRFGGLVYDDRLCTVAYKNKIYCFAGGLNYVYDVSADSWTSKTPDPAMRGRCSACVANGKIYVLGGWVGNSISGVDMQFLGLNKVYDPDNDSWTAMAPMIYPLWNLMSVVVDDKIYVFGSSNILMIIPGL
jgi:N-acetylneuraminic acid mutarotase